MAITVNAELMSALVDLCYQMRVLLNMFPDQKERPADILLCQHLQNLWCVLGVWTVVKG